MRHNRSIVLQQCVVSYVNWQQKHCIILQSRIQGILKRKVSPLNLTNDYIIILLLNYIPTCSSPLFVAIGDDP